MITPRKDKWRVTCQEDKPKDFYKAQEAHDQIMKDADKYIAKFGKRVSVKDLDDLFNTIDGKRST